MMKSIVGHTVGRIIVGARDATPGSIRDGFVGCVKVGVFMLAILNIILKLMVVLVICITDNHSQLIASDETE